MASYERKGRPVGLEYAICRSILETIAVLDIPSAINIAKHIGQRSVDRYLKVLSTLFVIIEVKPYKFSTGKSLYYLTDVGLAHYLGASFEKKLTTWFYLEILTQSSYKGIDLPRPFYFKTTRGNPIHLIYEYDREIVAVKLIHHEKFDERDYFIFDGLEKKIRTKKVLKKIVLAGATFKYGDISIMPWESIA